MIKLSRLACCVNEYRELVDSQWWWQVRHCSLCGRRMHLHGYYERYADELERCEKIPIRRYLCPGCRVTFSYPPSFLRPYRSLLVLVQELAALLWALGCRCGAWARSWGGRWTPSAATQGPGGTRHRRY